MTRQPPRSSLPSSRWSSVNPARSTATAVFVGGCALQQLWLFWLAPIVGAIIAGVTYRALFDVEEPPVTGRTRS